MDREIMYWQPRVMRHESEKKGTEYAIHEVYFDENHFPVSYTVDALSPRFTSVAELKTLLMGCLEQDKEEFIMGDYAYAYVKDHIEFWLEYIDEPPINYKKERIV